MAANPAGGLTPTMLKIDAEGHDLDVLEGALETVERMRPVILVEIWTGGAGPVRLLERFGYRPYEYDPAARSLTQIAPGHRQGGNILLICDAAIESIRGRVESAERPPLRAPSVSYLRRPGPHQPGGAAERTPASGR
jgi:hypothetical protein